MVSVAQWGSLQLCDTRMPSLMGACALAGQTTGGRLLFVLEKEAPDIVRFRGQVALFVGPGVGQAMIRRLSSWSGLCR